MADIQARPSEATDPYWQQVHNGALMAQRDLQQKGIPVEIIWKGPDAEDDRNAQVNLVESFIAQKVDGIVLAPLDRKALVRPVEEAYKARIPLVLIDSDVDTDKRVSLIGTNNRKAGYLAGEKLGALLNGKGNVLMMRYMPNVTATEEREAGFQDAIKTFPQIRLRGSTSPEDYAGPDPSTSYQRAQRLLARYPQGVDGVFTSSEFSTRGMLIALGLTGQAGKIKLIGFDTEWDLAYNLSSRRISGLLIPNPFGMGYEAVMTVVKAIHKQPVPKRIDTGVVLVTADTGRTPEMKELIDPLPSR